MLNTPAGTVHRQTSYTAGASFVISLRPEVTIIRKFQFSCLYITTNSDHNWQYEWQIFRPTCVNQTWIPKTLLFSYYTACHM